MTNRSDYPRLAVLYFEPIWVTTRAILMNQKKFHFQSSNPTAFRNSSLAFRLAIVCTISILVTTNSKSLEAASDESKPNVVIFYTDDQGTLDAGCYGSTDLHTPNIDRIAATGVRFTQAYAHTVCCPSRAALLTGRHPQRSGINSWTQGNMQGPDGTNMALKEVTIAELLKSAGYRTALFGKWHVGSHRNHGPRKQGFDEFFGIRNGFIDNFNHYFLHGKGYHDLYEGTTEVFQPDQYFPKLITDRALIFIEENKFLDHSTAMYQKINDL